MKRRQLLKHLAAPAVALAKHIHAADNLLNAFTLNLLTNDEVIAVKQDALGKQATCVQTIGDLRIYVRELEDGSRVAGFCNFGLEIVNISYKDLKKHGISGKQKARDLWRQKDITTIHADKEALSVKVCVEQKFDAL
jgi:alpha-galactosidase